MKATAKNWRHNYTGAKPVLILRRFTNESIDIGDDISIMVTEVRGGEVFLGIDAPKELTIMRRELKEEVDRGEREWSHKP